jgi:lipoprotein-releasing system ATP-binding protein
MVLGPSLLLADEPTGNLDRKTGEDVHRLFIELNRERGSTMLVVTHNPDLASLMPRCLQMVDGGIIDSTPDGPYHTAGRERSLHELEREVAVDPEREDDDA